MDRDHRRNVEAKISAGSMPLPGSRLMNASDSVERPRLDSRHQHHRGECEAPSLHPPAGRGVRAVARMARAPQPDAAGSP